MNERSIRVSRSVNRPKQTITLIEKKKVSGPFKPKGGKPAAAGKVTVTKVGKKHKLTSTQAYQGARIEKNPDRKKFGKKARWNKDDRKKNINSKILAHLNDKL